ncbi:MAG: hypothetical protein JNJ80_10025 [Gemmatimonadetes bacterium]|nr:hypothetical protein [Gemmatimonadota bacterium]MCC7134613.1 hypothetical protein [Gemmatimonadales bacterium]
MIRTLQIIGLAVGFGACGSHEPSGPSNDEIFGTWHATQVEYVSTTGGQRVDLIARGGSAVLVLGSDMSGTYSYQPPGGSVELRTFTWSRDGENITWLYGPGNDDNFKLSTTGGLLRFSHNGTKAFDCDGDGTQEPAAWTLTFAR